MKMIGRETSLREHPVFLGSWFFFFFLHETRAEKNMPLHAKEKDKRLD